MERIEIMKESELIEKLSTHGITVKVDYNPQAHSYKVIFRKGDFSFTGELSNEIVEDGNLMLIHAIRQSAIKALNEEAE